MILWNEKLIFTLNKIVKYLKRNNIGHILEYLGNFYIDKHDLIFKMDDYAMDFSEDYVIDTSLITAGEFKLSFICELGFLTDIMKNKDIDKHIISEDIYKYFSRMIRFGLENVYDIELYPLRFNESGEEYKQLVLGEGKDKLIIEPARAFHGTPTTMLRATYKEKTISHSSDHTFELLIRHLV